MCQAVKKKVNNSAGIWQFSEEVDDKIDKIFFTRILLKATYWY